MGRKLLTIKIPLHPGARRFWLEKGMVLPKGG
jgi:TRAP-type uncharacterized transport system substrate-binding protein